MYKALMDANSQEFKIVCMQSGYRACSSLYYLKKIVSFSEIHERNLKILLKYY